jgi:hypothetical protein
MMPLMSCVAPPKAVISDYCLVHKRLKLSEHTLMLLTENKNHAMVASDIKQIAKDIELHDKLCKEVH